MLENLRYHDERKRGEMEGLKKGEHQKACAIAQKMLKQNHPLSVISDLTELSEEEILELKKHLD